MMQQSYALPKGRKVIYIEGENVCGKVDIGGNWLAVLKKPCVLIYQPFSHITALLQ